VATPAPGNAAEAMDMVLAGLGYLAAADPTAFAAQAQAECLQALEQADSMSTVVRAWFLSAFTTGQGYAEDAVFHSRRQSSSMASKQRHDRLLDCRHRSGEACEGGHAGSDCAQEPEHSVLVWLVFLQLPVS